MAERLIMEMRDRLDDFDAAEMPVIAANTKSTSVSVLDEVESALVGLGFRPQEIALTLSQLDPPIDNIEDVLRRALKLLS
jgi:Holliday junction resolvasome RuvABC DNA-binding subunit